MPTFGHDLNCQSLCCALARAMRAEKRKLAKMTFHERKAYRIAKRAPTPTHD